MKDLSIIIPSRNEMFLSRTIEDILQHIEADTEVITVLDGKWADPPVPVHERVHIIFVPEPIGQRAAQNIAVRLSKAKYIMKVDAHCSFDQGFDRKMIEGFQKVGDDVTMVPVMRNLWAFDWKCMKCGKKWYQGPTPTACQEMKFKLTGQPCDGKKFKRKMMWVGKSNPQSVSYSFDSQPHFQYFGDYTMRPEYKQMKENGFTETMSLQGSCFMSTREKYWKKELSDESLGNWGNQGIEVALATWLTGGRALVNHNTWYAHMFRTQGGDFSFPWSGIKEQGTKQTKDNVVDKYWNNKHPKQVHPVSWLVEKFWPVKGWSDEDLQKLKSNTFKFTNSAARTNPAESEPTEEKKAIFFAGVSEIKIKRGRPKKARHVTIIGYGWVGKSVHNLFPDAYIYDPPKGDKKRASESKVAFICVPTPSIDNSKLDTSIVEECVAWCECPLIVIRSTVNPGTSDYLSKKYKKRIIIQPEYIGETAQNPLFEEKQTPFLVIGGNPEDRRSLINLYATVYNANVKIRQVTAYEAEIIKLTENRAISFKIAQCQELYDVCEKAGIDYYTIRDAVYGDDPRFTLWRTLVNPSSRGLNSNSILKDLYAWCAWAESIGVKTEITRSILKSNKKWTS